MLFNVLDIDTSINKLMLKRLVLNEIDSNSTKSITPWMLPHVPKRFNGTKNVIALIIEASERETRVTVAMIETCQ